MDDEDYYISDSQISDHDEEVNPDEKIDGQLSDDDAYVIPKPLTDMEKRRKKIKKV